MRGYIFRNIERVLAKSSLDSNQKMAQNVKCYKAYLIFCSYREKIQGKVYLREVDDVICIRIKNDMKHVSLLIILPTLSKCLVLKQKFKIL